MANPPSPLDPEHDFREYGREIDRLWIYRLQETELLGKQTAENLNRLEVLVTKMAEGIELREARVNATAEALAKETERRRQEIAERMQLKDRAFNRGDKLVALIFAAVMVVLQFVH